MRSPTDLRYGPLLALALADLGGAAAKAETGTDSAAQFEAVYTGEVFSNRRGGLRRGEEYLDNLDVTLTVDGEKLWHVPGLTLFAYALYNNTGSFSEKYSGDAFTATNIDAPRATRLYEAWVDYLFGAEGSHSIRAGLYDLNSEFDVSEPRSLFLNSVFGVGHDLGQTGVNGPSIFPVTSPGVRLDLELAPQWRLLGTVLDGVPGDADDPTATTVRLDSDDGLLLVAELQRLSSGPLEKLAFGVWNYTEEVDRIVPEGAEPLGTSTNRGWYVSADSRFGAAEDEQAGPWRTSVRAGVAEESVNDYDLFLATVLTYDLPTREGREQSLGLGAAWARRSTDFRSAAEERVDDYEAVLELTWRVTVTDWLTLQPDVQYIVNPSAARAVRNSLVLGLRFEVAAPALHW